MRIKRKCKNQRNLENMRRKCKKKDKQVILALNVRSLEFSSDMV